MPVFSYKAFDPKGKSVSGVKDADNLRALRAVLKRDGVLLVEAKEAALRVKAAGEVAGNLDAVLFRLAEFLDAQNRLRGKIVSAMFYPIVMTLVGVVIMGILMVSVVPKVTAIFADTGRALPWNTQMLITISSVAG